MKKLLMGLLLMLPLCGFAQKGMQGVGVNWGLGCDFGVGYDVQGSSCYGFSYQNFITDRFRLVSSLEVLDYVYDYDWDWYSNIVNEKAISYLLIVEGHYFLNGIRRLRPYVVGGVSVGSFESTGFDVENVEKRDPVSGFAGGVKLGVGLNYRIGYHMIAQLELPVHIVNPVGLFTPSLGLVYTF